MKTEGDLSNEIENVINATSAFGLLLFGSTIFVDIVFCFDGALAIIAAVTIIILSVISITLILNLLGQKMNKAQNLKNLEHTLGGFRLVFYTGSVVCIMVFAWYLNNGSYVIYHDGEKYVEYYTPAYLVLFGCSLSSIYNLVLLRVGKLMLPAKP